MERPQGITGWEWEAGGVACLCLLACSPWFAQSTFLQNPRRGTTHSELASFISIVSQENGTTGQSGGAVFSIEGPCFQGTLAVSS